MKLIIYIAYSVIGALIFYSSAYGGILIEPHWGYNLVGKVDGLSNTTKYNGNQYGARLGAQKFGLMGGLDYTHSTFTYKTVAPVESDDKSRDQLGVFVGYKFPILLRFWGEYNFFDKTKQSANGSNHASGYYTKGHGTALGVGFTGLPFLSVNLEYKTSSYNDSSAGALNPKQSTREVVLGVSIPINLP